ncbi:MAG: hypothetical protein L0G87_06590 [Renibacterium salmoninarum]|uniref:hypothetical protein n=1 Tax=Arthrobacter russicus TaxID=172040 RepID=UPI0025F2F184|nr:hypothetical protein [Renibacterium sp.]MDN5668048.1 hypothetical protein [Renibacterium salmoninarum]
MRQTSAIVTSVGIVALVLGGVIAVSGLVANLQDLFALTSFGPTPSGSGTVAVVAGVILLVLGLLTLVVGVYTHMSNVEFLVKQATGAAPATEPERTFELPEQEPGDTK